MKNKFLYLSLIFSCSVGFLVGCKNNDDQSSSTLSEESISLHQHRLEEKYEYTDTYHFKKCLDCNEIIEKEDHHLIEDDTIHCDKCGYTLSYTQEQLFSKWVEGRDYFANYEGEYTIESVFEEHDEQDPYADMEKMEIGKKGNEFYAINEEYTVNSQNETTLKGKHIEAIKNIVENGKEKTKYYIEVTEGGETRKRGSYVSPSYLEKSEILERNDYLNDYKIIEGNTYNEFLSATKESFKEEFGVEPLKVEFKNELDGAITLNIQIEAEFSGEDNEYVDYQKMTFQDEISVTVKDKKLVSIKSKYNNTNYYEDGNYKKYNGKETIMFSYDFKQETFDSISVETETTENHYYAFVYFDVEGYPLRFSDDAYVDKIYTASQAKAYLAGITSFIISSIDYNYETCISLYVDKDYQTPFVEKEITDDENFTLYVKFTMPEDLAIVVCVFQNTERSWIYLCYVTKVGKSYDTNYAYKEYGVLSIDGNKWKEGDSRVVECLENRAYVVVFDTPHLAG